MQNILEILQDTAIDTIKLIPFLFITYLIMEYIEHKTSNKLRDTIKKSGKFGPLLGAVVGIFPQCGFSVSATNLYAGRVITIGTLKILLRALPADVSSEYGLSEPMGNTGNGVACRVCEGVHWILLFI